MRSAIRRTILVYLPLIFSGISAIYAVIAYHTMGEKIKGEEKKLKKIVDDAFSKVTLEDIKYGVDFSKLDMDFKLSFVFDDIEDEYRNFIQIDHKVGRWKLTPSTTKVLKQILRNIRRYLLDRFDTEVEIKIVGTADNIPIVKLENGRNCPYKGKNIGRVQFYTQNDKKKRVYNIYNGVELTNELIALLRAVEAAKVVEEVIRNPKLYAITLDEKGVRKAIIGIRIKDALRDKYNEMNDLEKTVFNIQEFLTPK